MTRWLALGLLLCACPKDEPSFDENDPLLKKLKAEQARLDREASARRRAEEANKPLTDALAANQPPVKLQVPAGVAADLGDVQLRLESLLRTQTVGTGKVSITTVDRFLQVTLSATAKQATTLALNSAELVRGELRFQPARDAQRAGGGSPWEVSLSPGRATPVVLYFEVPPEIIGEGLKVTLSTPTAKVELPLQ